MKIKHGYGFDDVLLVPRYSDVESRLEPDTSIYVGKDIYNHPIVAANMDCISTLEMRDVQSVIGGLFIHHRFVDVHKEVRPHEYVTLGMRDYGQESWDDQLCRIIVDQKANVCIDIAHAHSKNVISAVKYIQDQRGWYDLDTKIMVGNIATADAARDLCMAGVDILKCGIGGGFSCTTRLVTGVGIPAITAIDDVSQVCKQFGVKVIADGGIRDSSDVAKAIAAGADFVMVGALFAGTNEAGGKWCGKYGEPVTRCVCEGDPMSDENYENHDERFHVDINDSKEYLEEAKLKNKNLHRVYWGQSSKDFQTEYYGGVKPGIVPEGETTYVPYCGSVLNVIKELVGGLQSSMTYLGARTVGEFQRKAEFIITNQIKEV